MLRKLLLGLALSLIVGWLAHGPLGLGERFIDRLEAEARAAVRQSELAGIDVRMSRDPLARDALLSGPANDIQREGLGSQPGVKDYARRVEGVRSVRWSDEPPRGAGLPLLAETLILCAAAYVIGVALGWLLWGRRRRERFA